MGQAGSPWTIRKQAAGLSVLRDRPTARANQPADGRMIPRQQRRRHRQTEREHPVSARASSPVEIRPAESATQPRARSNMP